MAPSTIPICIQSGSQKVLDRYATGPVPPRAGSIMFLQLCPRALWWLPDSLYWPRLAAWAAAFLAGVGALTSRVALAAFGAYVKLPAPWSWLVVTAGTYPRPETDWRRPPRGHPLW
jgi:hypothetical protein